ncbi:protein fuzzy homolog [Pomacea canaliculata]|uniref:protein fuzzy homolog n=1 Tax=Pomacea canaliculata TaxID=400727 RepID=UPI000D725BD8|nr:protein fuzzy homolog [Pomacea canaliculata]
MAAYLLCLSAGGGIPIFTRSHGDVKPLPFPVIGSLNAVHMFATNHGASLKSTTTDDAKIVWRDFYDSLSLILVMGDDQADDCHMFRLLENVWSAMVLHCGRDELVNIKNLERFKREVKVCFQLIDRLLQGAVLGTFSDLTQAADLLLTPDNAALQNFLEAFVMAADSPYGCLMVDGHVVVATQKWWSLSGTELVLLGMLVSGLPPSTSRDVPIYLPHGSPTVPHRLLTFQLINGVEACVICGPKPTLFDLQGEVVRFWRPALDILRTASHVIPCNFPNTVSLDQNILGFLLVNNETSRCLNTVGVNRDNAAGLTMDKRREILRSFYKKVIGTYFSSPIEGSERGPTEFSHVPTDTYIVCDSYKCYALVAGSYQIFVLYSSAIPTYAMRSVTNKTLNTFVKDKSFII